MQQNKAWLASQYCACRDPKSTKMKGKKNKTLEPKGKGIARYIYRWHGAVSTDLMKPDVLQPKNEPSNESDSECSSIPEGKQDGLGWKVKKTLGKLLFLSHHNHHQSHEKLMKSIIPLVAISLFTATIQVGYDVEEAETEKLIGNKLVLRSRRTSRRVSVTSLPIGLQKVENFFFKCIHICIFTVVVVFVFQVDDLIETVADRSVKLLAQRHAELEQCKFLGDVILQSSKQFQRISQKSARKYKWKNLCFPCVWCC
ncbi:putative uncharacterized protein C3orf49 [Polyodon spathula]|uniref:putative uncharacterized protein C3orf49 n=1 Tax=Polyodon spathula TaxID=7913 RepID=UPI001B7EFF95|nr:putative uncharacterized protein C3orf49 [Polyodon spathula]